MISTVIFDWGGVLIDSPGKDLMLYCASALNVEPSTLKNLFSEFKSDFQKGTVPESTIWQQICNQLEIPVPQTESLWKDAVAHCFNNKQDVYEIVRNLRQQGYKTGFLSNTEPPAMEYFFEHQYEQYFDATIFSCKEHLVKPDPDIYRLILHKLQAEPEETVFIDDKQSNLEGAKLVGMHTILFENPSQLIQDLRALSVNL